jgi:hypothetical protein
MALPLLDAMLPLSALAQSFKKERAIRMAFLSVPNGIHMPAWTPKIDGPDFVLPSILEPLKNVRESVMILTGLTQNGARPLGDGPGDHARSASAWLTGCHPKKTSGADIHVGISVDQLAAHKLGGRTPFPSLELGCERGAQAGDCDSGYSCAYSSTISWRTATTPVAKETSPRLVFERLFSNGDPNETAASRKLRQQERRSILDFVMDDASQLKTQLGAHDQQKLDEYFSSVREIEDRLQAMERSKQTIQQIRAKDPTFASQEPGIPADYGEQIRLMCDMMVLAFQADLTRICSFMLANEGSNRSYRLIGVPEGHHDMSHHGGDAVKQDKIRQINRFHTTQLAYLLEKLKAIPEGDGTLLDNCMIVYGSGISDGNAHNHDDLPTLVAGKGGGRIRSGRHITYPDNTPMANLFLSMLDCAGVPGETIGDSTGRLQQLF